MKPLRSSNSATPSSAGDIEPTLPAPTLLGPSTLSVRVDKEPRSHNMPSEHHAPTAFVAPRELHISDVSVEEHAQLDQQPILGEDNHREGVQLGPSEFAIPVPMDARVKDDYETTMSNESKSIRKFITESGSGDTMEVDVSSC
jgi:hypothetical protein